MKKLRRIASLDFQRGLAIWLMVLLHAIEFTYDVTWAYDLDVLFTKPIYVVVIIFFLAYLGSFAGYFLLISATVNALAQTKRAMRGESTRRILNKQLLTGLGVLIAGQLTESLGFWGYLGWLIRGSGFATNFYSMWARLFIIETLQTIGWCMIINGVIHYFLMRNKGHEKFKRNVLIYAGLALLVIIISPMVWAVVDNLPWSIPAPEDISTLTAGDTGVHTRWPSEHVQAANASFLTWILVILTGDLEPLLPYLATSFIGSIIGMVLVKPDKAKRLPRYGGLVVLGLFISFGVLLLFGMPFDITFLRPTISYYLFALAGQLGLIVLLFWLVDLRGDPNKFANNRVVKYFRSWGMIALSIYSLRLIEFLPKWVISLFTGIDLVSGQFLLKSELPALAISGLVVLCFSAVVYLWSKKNFKYSFEWFIIRLASLGTKEKVSERLNVDKMMNEVEWIKY